MTDFQLNRIEGTDIFFLAKENIKLLGETLIAGTFDEVKSYAEILKQEAEFVGEGFTIIENTQDLINIDTERWYLLELLDRFQIIKTGDVIYSLPTNYIAAAYGSLDKIFNFIEQKINT